MKLTSAEKQTLINFLEELAVKIAHDSPNLADLLLADQTAKGTKE